jgi:hypothetical protein
MAYPWFEAPWGRVDFTIDQLRHLLDPIEGELRRGDADESEEIERLSRAVEATFGEDVWIDADVEFTAERFGEDPDMPGVPFYAFGSLFPRVTRYAFVMLATMLSEGELRPVLLGSGCGPRTEQVPRARPGCRARAAAQVPGAHRRAQRWRRPVPTMRRGGEVARWRGFVTASHITAAGCRSRPKRCGRSSMRTLT